MPFFSNGIRLRMISSNVGVRLRCSIRFRYETNEIPDTQFKWDVGFELFVFA